MSAHAGTDLRAFPALAILALLLGACFGPEDCATPDIEAGSLPDTVSLHLWDPYSMHGATSGGVVRDTARFSLLKAQVAGADSSLEWVFIGNSIIQYLSAAGREQWDRHFAGKAINLGVGGDRTQDMIYRLDNGHLDFPAEARPRFVVFLGGTNNIGTDTPLEIAEGVRAVLQRIASKWPETRIILMGLFPRDKGFAGALKGDVFSVNALLRDYGGDPQVTYLDIGQRFILRNGCIDPGLMYDGLHLGSRGYQVWVEALLAATSGGQSAGTPLR